MADEEVCVGAKEKVEHLGVRIGAIFVIWVSSAVFTLLPIITKRIPRLTVPAAVYDIAKYFGSGVIIATAFIHLLEPANDELSMPCLNANFQVYPMAYGFALISLMLVFMCEFFAYRVGSKIVSDSLGASVHHHAAGHNDAHDVDEPVATHAIDEQVDKWPVKHVDEEGAKVNKAAMGTTEVVGVLVLEFGIVFHSVIIGLTLATSPWDGDERFPVLFPVIVFHQLFEGLGLGSRLAMLPRELGAFLPSILGMAYAIVTPIGMAIGLGLRQTYTQDTATGYYVTGIFDAFSAGILIYTGLVELLAHDFIFNKEMQRAPLGKVLLNMFEVCAGAGVMALLAPQGARAQSTASKAERLVAPVDPATLPRGFLVSSTYAGIKKAISPAPAGTAPQQGVPKPDMALVVSSSPAAVAGVFTQNVFKAAPVVQCTSALVDGQSVSVGGLAGPRTRAVLTNSGCANAVTGDGGLRDSEALSDAVRADLGIGDARNPAEVLMMSTGVIGVRLPVAPMARAIKHLTAAHILQGNPGAWLDVARAYMTTDTFPKLRTRQFILGDRRCSMLAIDKGAGMIHPHMATPAGLHATLLGLFATDAPIAPDALQQCLDTAVRVSFNCISVDGDMSTNDTILALANGQAPQVSVPGAMALPPGVEITRESHPAHLKTFQEELTQLCLEMAHLIVRDGEGAEKFVEVRVRVRTEAGRYSRQGAPTEDVARAVAASISTSALVKCAMHGEDANWGRILCAAGYAALPGDSDWAMEPSRVNVTFQPPAGASEAPLATLVNGTPQAVDEAHAARLLAHEDICIDVNLRGGSWGDTATSQCTYWTCDFSKEYVAVCGGWKPGNGAA
ncbi:hypothetical protein MSPP1_004102 [Malassezia sp. CBS 17886]|nr:hypothetical protein MSPP1_004102 [Malassezia sp. CBS 17886]